jgi:hypothetical protein
MEKDNLTNREKNSLINSEFGRLIDSKDFNTYLEELKEVCEHDIYLKRTANIEYSRKTSSNIQAYILWFNRLSLFVRTEIVKNLKVSRRAKVVSYFIDVAYSCSEYGNFNSTMAIVGKPCFSLFIDLNFFGNSIFLNSGFEHF